MPVGSRLPDNVASRIRGNTRWTVNASICSRGRWHGCLTAARACGSSSRVWPPSVWRRMTPRPPAAGPAPAARTAGRAAPGSACANARRRARRGSRGSAIAVSRRSSATRPMTVAWRRARAATMAVIRRMSAARGKDADCFDDCDCCGAFFCSFFDDTCADCGKPLDPCDTVDDCCPGIGTCGDNGCDDYDACCLGDGDSCLGACDCCADFACDERAGNTCQVCALPQDACVATDDCCLLDSTCGDNGCDTEDVCCQGAGGFCFDDDCDCCGDLLCDGDTCVAVPSGRGRSREPVRWQIRRGQTRALAAEHQGDGRAGPEIGAQRLA